MQVRIIALLAGGLATLGALVLLLLQLLEAPSTKIDQKELEALRARELAAAATRSSMSSSRPLSGDPAGSGESRRPDPFAAGSIIPKELDIRQVAKNMRPPRRPGQPPPIPPEPFDFSTLPPDHAWFKKLPKRTPEQRITYAQNLYAANDYAGAFNQARLALQEKPGDVPTLQMLISTACAIGYTDVATTHLEQLPAEGRDLVIERCAEHGVSF